MGDRQRHQHINQSGDKHVRDLVHRRDILSDPKQDGRHITNRRPHEPPAFAAIITIQAYFKRSVRSGMSLRNTAMITIAAAKLSNKAEKKRVAKLYIPQQLTFIRRTDIPGNGPKTTMLIHDIHDQHGTHHEKSVSETFPETINNRTVRYKINKLLMRGKLTISGFWVKNS